MGDQLREDGIMDVTLDQSLRQQKAARKNLNARKKSNKGRS